MDNFDNSTSGTCLVCAGHSQGSCFCPTETYLALRYQNSQASQDYIVEPQPQHLEPVTENAKPRGTYVREKKDNVAYKQFNVVAQNIYKQLTGKQLDAKYTHLYCRKEYFDIILSQFEREGKNEQAQILFEQDMVPFMEKLEKKHHDKPEYLDFLRKLVKDHLKAFYEFNSGQIEVSLKSVFDYDNMRHRAKFAKALESVQKVRKEMGLSF